MNRIITNCPYCGKIITGNTLEVKPERKPINCPMCGSQNTCKDGKRHTRNRDIQRYLCSDCGHRFSEHACFDKNK